MSAATVRYPAYHSDYLALMEQCKSDGPSWLDDLRSAAWQRFDELGFPTARRGNERWKYTSVAPLARAEFTRPVISPDAAGNGERIGELRELLPSRDFPDSWLELDFVDGHPLGNMGNMGNPGGEPATVSSTSATTTGQGGAFTIGSLAEALTAEPEVVRQNLGRLAAIEDDSFVALNTAFLNDGAYVRLSDDCSQQVVLCINYLTTGINHGPDNGSNICTHPRTLIVAGRNTRITVIETYTCSGLGNRQEGDAPRYFTNAVTEIVVGEGAAVDHYRLLDESRNAFHVGTTRVSQDKDSSYTSGSFSLGAAMARQDSAVLLDGAGAYCSLNGLYMTDDTQHIDNLISIDHAKPHGTSRLFYKGILGGRSRAVFGGTVLVREDAQKTDAQQTDKNLILSDRAEVDSKPSLLIYADDVKCGHGATAGHIDDDTLFYMRSRGIDPETASRILIHAFASEIIESVPPELEPLRDYLDRLFLNIIPGKIIPIPGASPLVEGA